MTEKPITRIDLEKLGENEILVKEYREGWQEGSSADLETIKTGYMIAMLGQLEKAGYTVEMCDANTGRALRGRITRVDMVKLPDGWHYRKYPMGWTAKTRPLVDQIKTTDEVCEILTWCRSREWAIREWPGGYRAFLGEPKPVRDRAGIMAMRRKVQSEMSLGHASDDNRSQFDFAFDF